jgi:ADP-heptose:LPS heptosyltransferase
MKYQKLLLTCYLSPGDIIMLTAAVRDIHRNYPGKFAIDVDTTASAIWENNPHIVKLKWHKEGKEIILDDKEIRHIHCHYPLVDQSSQRPYHFIHGFIQYLEDQLKLSIRATEFRGDIHISDLEKSWSSQVEDMGIKERFWLIVSGGKKDFTTKWWDYRRYQEVVNHFKNKITFIQCGEKHDPHGQGHWQPPLENVIDLRGKTDIRQLIRLVYHCVGIVSPVTFLMHLAAAVEMKYKPPINRPCVVIAGGREATHWEAYPYHRYLHTLGALDCCDNGGCWRSRCQLVGDGDEKDTKNLCEKPVQILPDFRIPKCMDMIRTEDVIRAIESYYEGGVLKYIGT